MKLTKEQQQVMDNLSDKEMLLVRTIYRMCEEIIIMESGDFNNSYAEQNSRITGLVMDMVQDVRDQINWQKQKESRNEEAD